MKSEIVRFLPSRDRLMIVLVGDTVIAALLWAANGQASFFGKWLVSQYIGLSICLLFSIFHAIVAKPAAYGLPMFFSVLLGMPLGIGLAHLSGVQGIGWHLAYDWQIVGRYLISSVIFTFAFIYVMATQARLERLRREQQDAQIREAQGQRAILLARLSLLQAQVEPHFLFNTLANLHSLIGRDDALARALLERFNDYLRASLAHSRASTATLGDECRMLEAYLAVQQMRMGGRLAVQVDVPEALRSLAFPPMLLQPLVENAVRHGIEPLIGAGSIKLRARDEGGMLRICVEDDGVGFGNGMTSGGNGVGISSVRERLAALYEDRARLEIREGTPAGVSVELCLPLA